MTIGSPDSTKQLLEVAVRVLTTCANGQYPSPSDIELLEDCALPTETHMEPAERAGLTVWRLSRNKVA